jgi:ABC-type multidrug transport system fused ATPase/permease subunit
MLNDALRASGLFSLETQNPSNEGEGVTSAESSGAGRGLITLDTPIAHSGDNFSFGQRQVLALARAILRGSKILILDEGSYFVMSSHTSGLTFCL